MTWNEFKRRVEEHLASQRQSGEYTDVLLFVDVTARDSVSAGDDICQLPLTLGDMESVGGGIYLHLEPE